MAAFGVYSQALPRPEPTLELFGLAVDVWPLMSLCFDGSMRPLDNPMQLSSHSLALLKKRSEAVHIYI